MLNLGVYVNLHTNLIRILVKIELFLIKTILTNKHPKVCASFNDGSLNYLLCNSKQQYITKQICQPLTQN